MDVIAHKAVGVNFDLMGDAVFFQAGKVTEAVGLCEEYGLAVISPGTNVEKGIGREL